MLFIVTALVSFFVAILAIKRRSVVAAGELSWLMIATGLGAFWLIFETSAPDMAGKIFWTKLEYSSGLAVPVLYLLFAFRFTGNNKLLTRKNIILLFIIPSLTFLLAVTNEKHNLIWSGYSPISEKTNLMEYFHGIWFWIGYISYSYIMLLIAAVYIINYLIHQAGTFRSQAWVIFCGGMFPWIASIIYLMGASPVRGLDLTPFSLTVSGSLAAYAILHFRFLDLVPVARETLVEILPDGILAIDSRNRIQDINAAAINFLGISGKNIIGTDVSLSGATVTNLLNAVVEKNSSDRIEVGENNNIKSYSIIKKAIKDNRGSRLVIIRDITLQMRSIEALKESESQKSAILRALPDMLFVLNPDGCFIDYFTADSSKLILPGFEFIGKNITAVFPPYLALEAITSLKKSYLNNELVCFSYSVDNVGKKEYYEARIIPATSDKILVIVRDMTDQKLTEQELIKAKDMAEESDRLKSAFLANMSHEIRTPMNGIMGFTELMEMTDISNVEKHEYLSIIRKSGDRMLNIINDIIDISKIESGQMKVLISKTNVKEQIDSIYSFFKPEADAKGIQLIKSNSLPAKESVIETDTDKLIAILTNLVKNSIKFTDSGFVEFGFEKKNNYFEFLIKDSGIGIGKEQQKYIFERFRQGSELLRRNYEGTGLGLSISKAYTEMLGGTIWFDSELGKGSEFRFRIPYKPVRESPEELPLAAVEKPMNPKIKELVVLIVEDDKPSELLIKRLVSPFSKKILIADNGLKAIEICRENPDVDLVLMDVKLPEMDGYEAIQHIRKFNKDLIIIAQTAFGLLGDKEKALKAGFNDYISKPIKSDLLQSLIEKYFSN